MSTSPSPPPASPGWSSTTKLVAGLTIVAIMAALMIQFRNIIGPLILSFILAYLLFPVAGFLSRRLHVSWRVAVNFIYLILLLMLISTLTATGFAVVQQIQSVVGFVENFVKNLPELAKQLSTQVYVFGPFRLSLDQFDLQTLSNQLLSTLQPLLGRATTVISTVATSAVTTTGWSLFVLLISYFLLADADRLPDTVIVDIPGYTNDIRRLGSELKNIWNAFLRGQFLIIALVIAIDSTLLMILGVRYAVGIAVLAGLGRFIPYIGPLLANLTLFLVAYFQGHNYFGLSPLQYALMATILAIVLDQTFDNLVSPRLLGSTLGVHPAAVLIVAIIATNLIGVIGLILAAPVLATMQLLGRYVVRKMFDLDPWPPSDQLVQPFVIPWVRQARRMNAWWRAVQRRRKG